MGLTFNFIYLYELSTDFWDIILSRYILSVNPTVPRHLEGVVKYNTLWVNVLFYHEGEMPWDSWIYTQYVL